jgi:restriction system protein
MTRLWLVRAGRNGERELDVISQSRLMLGFSEVGDLSRLGTREAVQAEVRQSMPDAKEGQVRNFAAQLNQFANQMAIGDLVVLPRRLVSGIAMGRITGPYVFDPGGSYRHTRTVKWEREAVPRQSFQQDLRFSFGAIMTVCEVKRNNALARVEAMLKNGTDPGPLDGKQGKIVPKANADEIDAADAAIDIEEEANEQILSLIKSRFAGHDLATLVAQILAVEGYTTKVSPPGPDGGVDILAAGGRLGLGADRICVQVKSGDSPANRDVVLKLMGSMSATKAKTGLLVSVAGVNGPAQKQLEDDFFGLRLWTMKELLQALYRTYQDLPVETRSKLPLRQIWAPTPEAEV